MSKWMKINNGKKRDKFSAPLDCDVVLARITKRGHIAFAAVGRYEIEKYNGRTYRGWYIPATGERVNNVTHWSRAYLLD